jgi:flagellar motor protein MotB
MVKSFRGHSRAQELDENTLFTTPQERTALVADKSRVANAFLLNFFGTLGMINATKPAQKRALLTFIKTDKKLRIDTIDDTNNDMSLSLKLAADAGFFTNPTTVAEITRFLVKLKAGQIDHIDSAVVGKWAVGMKPDFLVYIRDPAARRIFNQFRMDEGKTIDVSSIAVVLKTRVNKMSEGGDFQRFAKRFIGLTAISPTATTPVAAAPIAQPAAAPAPTAPVKLSYYQKQKLKKQQAAAGTTATPTPAPAAAPAPKLSYYQKQKLKKDQAKADAAKIAADAAAVAKAAADLKAKEEEENRKAAAAAVKKMPREDFDKMVEQTIRPGYGLSGYAITPSHVKMLFKFDIVPDIYIKSAELLTVAVDHLQTIINDSGSSGMTYVDNNVKLFNQTAKELEKVSGYLLTIPQFVMNYGDRIRNNAHRLAYAAINDGQPITDEFYSKVINVSSFPFRSFLSLFHRMDPNLAKLAKLIANNDSYLNSMAEDGKPLYILFLRLSMAWGSNVAPYEYSSEYVSSNAFAILLLKAAPKPFEYFITKFDNIHSRALVYVFKAYGMGSSNDVSGIDPIDKKYMNDYVKYFLENDFKNGYQSLRKTLLRDIPAKSTWQGGYSPDYPLAKALHDEFAVDVISKGYSASKLFDTLKAPITEYYMKEIFKFIGVDLGDLVKAHPNDPASVYISAVTNGLSSVSPKQLAATLISLQTNSSSTFSSQVAQLWRSAESMVNGAQGDRDQNCNSIAQAMLEVAYTRPADFKSSGQYTGEALMRYLPYANQDTVVKWLKFAKESDNKWVMGSELYKSIHKSKKQDYVDILTGIVQDSIGTEVEDYVNDIMESLAPHVIQKMRGNLVGANAVIGELNKGEIKPFDKIDANRLKKIFLYNDLNMSAIVSGQVEKKKKTESYAQYFARASKAIQSSSLLGAAKVKPDPKADAKAINKIMIQRDHAGKHGDTYPKIDKVYDASLEFPEFWEFRKKKPKDGSITPAYHGTGGIAASMILRYGFKVIKSSDPSVVGRMLGDGIYFSNKIDKVSQYVSNGGYSRQHGQKGYVMEMDVNLGTERVDYRSAGTKAGDGIRSPEWCVVDPKAQTRIVRVYEVTLVSKATVDRYLNEGVQYKGLKGFRQHLKEEVVQDLGNSTSFIFRDGMIPIVDYETSAVSYVDFEEALSKKLINEDMFDVSAQGPVIVFRNAPEQLVIDERFASHMGGDDLQLYIELFKRNMAPQ